MLSKLGAARRALMASIGSLSPFLPRGRLPSASPVNPNPSLRLPPRGARTLRYLTRAERKDGDDAPSSPAAKEKRSLAVATGELFLGLASMVIRTRTNDEVVLMEREREYYSQKLEQAAPLVDDDRRIAGEDVIWEQKPEDVEAERERPVVTSPGFSFSAAGLLFPYHLGVAQFLLEKGYIKETTPLAGSSAGAIVCAVVASGNTMQEAMQVTKVLAEDCRLKGTAFRLGAVLRDILDKFLPDDIHIRSNGRIRSWRLGDVWKQAREKFSSNAYDLDLPTFMSLSRVMDVHDLTLYRAADDSVSQFPAISASMSVLDFQLTDVPTSPVTPIFREQIDDFIDDQIISARSGVVQKFLVKWYARLDSHCTWIIGKELQSINPELLEQYQTFNSTGQILPSWVELMGTDKGTLQETAFQF